MSEKKLGRPVEYDLNHKDPEKRKRNLYILALLTLHTASMTRRILNAPKRNSIARNRNHKLIPAKGLNVSLPTLHNMAKAAKVNRKQGRPTKIAA